MIDKLSAIPLYIQLAEHIRDLIYSGEFDDDCKLPAEAVWMEKFSLGRATVRAAYAELVKDDLIYKKQGVGTFVKKQTARPGMLPLISLDYILKSSGITTQNKVMEKKTIVIYEALKKKFLNNAPNNNLSEVYLIKRMRYAKEFPVAIETSYFLPETAKQFQDTDVTGSVAELLLSNQDIELTRVNQDIITKEPTVEEKKLLNLKKGETILVMNRWLYKNGEDIPFSFMEFIFPLTFLTYPFKYRSKT